MQYLDYYCLHLIEHDDKDKPTIMNAAICEVLGSERRDRRAEVNKAIEDERQSVDAKLAELEERLKSSPGKLPVVKSWQPETVIYQSEMVAFNGATYQAKRDTAQKPGGSDWICIARHGRDAITPTVRGNFNVNGCYAPLDIVTFDDAAYIAQRDDPGFPGHGDGWQVLSRRGKQGRRGEGVKGPQGEKGARREKGDAASEIVSWSYDVANYRAIPFASNGTPLPALDLRPFLEHFLAEVSGVG
jgi:hypothetical protein